MFGLEQFPYFNLSVILPNIVVAFITGIYATIIFATMSHFINATNRLAKIGVFNQWIILAVSLYTFGVIKHGIGYYLAIESNYCKQTAVCERMLKETHTTIIDFIKSTIGLLGNVGLENVGEGIMFVLVGLPAFLMFDNKLLAAFITGFLADIMSEYSGFHQYFCRTSCNVIPGSLNL